MPKKYFYFLMLASLLGSAQTINFPDANFKELLLNIDTNPSVYAKDIDGNFIAIDTNEDGEIQVAEAQTVAALYISGMGGYVTDMGGIEYFTTLRELSCGSQLFSTLDVTPLIHLEKLSCGNNPISSLNVTGLSSLTELWCGDSNISSLDLTGLTNLTRLSCPNTLLSAIDVSGLNNLEILDIKNNDLTSLNLSGLSNFIGLDCASNHISSLNLTGATALRSLHCANNNLTELDLHEFTELRMLTCDENDLTMLNITGLSKIESIYCTYNQITVLDVTSAALLQQLNCSNNTIQSLNISNCPGLFVLYCDYNELTTLNASNNSILASLTIGNNNLESLYLKNDYITNLYFSQNPDLSYICADEFEINMIQNMIDNLGYDCSVTSDCSLETEGFSFNESISTYPNPAENTLYLNNMANLILETTEAYNLSGQAVIKASNTQDMSLIDISSLSPGTYILKVTHNKGVFASKFIKK